MHRFTNILCKIANTHTTPCASMGACKAKPHVGADIIRPQNTSLFEGGGPRQRWREFNAPQYSVSTDKQGHKSLTIADMRPRRPAAACGHAALPRRTPTPVGADIIRPQAQPNPPIRRGRLRPEPRSGFVAPQYSVSTDKQGHKSLTIADMRPRRPAAACGHAALPRRTPTPVGADIIRPQNTSLFEGGGPR